MRIPIVLPVLDVLVAPDGGLTVMLDGAPYDTQQPLGRRDLKCVVEQITAELQSPVRVDVIEADGTTYADIATPSQPTTSEPGADSPGAPATAPTPVSAGFAASGFAATGFDPGEEVAIAYVLARHTTDADGSTSWQLPPAILAAHRRGLVLVGLTSGRVTPLSEAM